MAFTMNLIEVSQSPQPFINQNAAQHRVLRTFTRSCGKMLGFDPPFEAQASSTRRLARMRGFTGLVEFFPINWVGTGFWNIAIMELSNTVRPRC